MTRTGPTFGGRRQHRAGPFCNVRHAALMIRIHADGSPDRVLHGDATLVPAFHRGWTDDIYRRSLRAGDLVQTAVVLARGAQSRVMQRGDLTGFNWANVPAVLVESGFMTNARERRLLQSPGYQLKVARGLAAGAELFVPR